MTSDSKITGSCVCKSVSITISHPSKVLRTMACHCLHCQKGAGGPCQTNAVFDTEDVVVQDDSAKLAKYLFPSQDVDSGHEKEKWFCSVSVQCIYPCQLQSRLIESPGMRLHHSYQANEIRRRCRRGQNRHSRW